MLQAYQFIFKRNVTYIAYIVAGAVVLEGVFGTVSKSFWDAKNAGVSGALTPLPFLVILALPAPFPDLTCPPHPLPLVLLPLLPRAPVQRMYHNTDWSKFKTEDE
jgi:hypothetical protein